jgi:hypothetical protein
MEWGKVEEAREIKKTMLGIMEGMSHLFTLLVQAEMRSSARLVARMQWELGEILERILKSYPRDLEP